MVDKPLRQDDSRDIIDIVSDSIVVRKLPAGLKQRLRVRAAAHGRSVEAEVRAILMDMVYADDFVVTWLEDIATLPPGEELVVPERSSGREPVELE